jgi:Peptidase_C39 like family
MARVRFTPHHEEIPAAPVRRAVRQTESLPMLEPPMQPVPTALPPGYTEAISATQRYSRSYTRLSRSMMNTYGPIPRQIPREYLRKLAPAREPITEPIHEDDEHQIAPPAPADRSLNKTIVTTVCVLLAIVLLGSWAGSQFVSSTVPKIPANQKITRIFQLDTNQYTSQESFDTWAYSACSTASMTEVIDAYGHDYRIADILQVEADQKQITPDLGLLYGASSIKRTVSSFGFSAQALNNASLDNVLAVANSGTPVIVGFMDPIDFPSGHILVVRGGSGDTVDLVDSSKLNLKSMSRASFLHFYDGFAVLVTPNDAISNNASAPVHAATGYSVLGPPSISADQINQVLTYYHSPAAGQGQALYDLGVKYGVDPVFPLAFFMSESTFGTQGMATSTLALGNERCLSDRPCVNTQGLPCGNGQSCYAQFYSWDDSFEHWYMLITGPLYKGAGRTTVATIIPRYAPGSDHNDEANYIAVVEHAVDSWRAGKVGVA